MSASGLVALSDVQQALLDVWEWSGESPSCPGWAGDPSECPEGPPKYPEVVSSPSRMSGSGREALSDVRECSGDRHRCPGVVKRLSQMYGSGRKTPWMSRSGWIALPDVRDVLPVVQEWSGCTP